MTQSRQSRPDTDAGNVGRRKWSKIARQRATCDKEQGTGQKVEKKVSRPGQLTNGDRRGGIRRSRKAAAAATTEAGDAKRVLIKLQVRQQGFFFGETDLRCTFFLDL